VAHARLTRGRHTAKTPLSQVIPKREDLSIVKAAKNPYLPAGMTLLMALVLVAVHCLSVRFVTVAVRCCK
jgi:hypothetical protein